MFLHNFFFKITRKESAKYNFFFQSKLNDAILADTRMAHKNEISEAVLVVELVKGKSLVEYTGEDDTNFAKITLALPKFVPVAKRLLTTTTVYQPLATHTFFPFESNVDIETRYYSFNYQGRLNINQILFLEIY